MRNVFLRINGLGRDIVIEESDKIYLSDAESAFDKFCQKNKISGKFNKMSFKFNGDIIIHANLEIKDLRDFKIKSINII